MISVLGLLIFFIVHQPSAPACGGLCQARASATAFWYVWNQLDCDEADMVTAAGSPGCNDELQDVNRKPYVERLVSKSVRMLDVYLRVYLRGGALSRERVTVDTRWYDVVASRTLPA